MGIFWSNEPQIEYYSKSAEKNKDYYFSKDRMCMFPEVSNDIVIIDREKKEEEYFL